MCAHIDWAVPTRVAQRDGLHQTSYRAGVASSCRCRCMSSKAGRTYAVLVLLVSRGACVQVAQLKDLRGINACAYTEAGLACV